MPTLCVRVKKCFHEHDVRAVVVTLLLASSSILAVPPTRPLVERPQGSIVGWGAPIPDTNELFTAVAAGLGLKADGSIVEWDYRGNVHSSVPQPNAEFVSIAAGGRGKLGLKIDGTIVAWGGINYVPAPNADFVAVAAGDGHNMALKADGSVVAWGCPDYNDYGQCYEPMPNNDFVGLAGGGDYSLGLKSDGSVVAWGCGGVECADLPACKFTYCILTAQTPPSNGDFVSIAARFYRNLGLKADGRIVAWTASGIQLSVPEPNADFIAVAQGYYHGLGLKADGMISTWGDNTNGQTAVPFPNSGFIAVAAGYYHSLAIRLRPGDFDGDGLVNLLDLHDFSLCLAGPETAPTAARWRFLDLDDDFDVDLADFQLSQNFYTGSSP